MNNLGRIVEVRRLNGRREFIRTTEEKLIEVRTVEKNIEYWEVNQYKCWYYHNAHPVEEEEIVETYNFELELFGKEIFEPYLNIRDISNVCSFLAKSYIRLYHEHIKNSSLLEASPQIVEKEYCLRTTIDHIREVFPNLDFDSGIQFWKYNSFSSSAKSLITQILGSVPTAHGPINDPNPFIIPYQRRFK